MMFMVPRSYEFIIFIGDMLLFLELLLYDFIRLVIVMVYEQADLGSSIVQFLFGLIRLVLDAAIFYDFLLIAGLFEVVGLGGDLNLRPPFSRSRSSMRFLLGYASCLLQNSSKSRLDLDLAVDVFGAANFDDMAVDVLAVTAPERVIIFGANTQFLSSSRSYLSYSRDFSFWRCS